MAHTIEQGVLDRCPWLVNITATTDLISRTRVDTMHELKKPFSKESETDTDLEDESNYEHDEKAIIMEMVSYQMAFRKGVENVAGISGAAPSGAKVLKKGKAGQAEAEFHNPKVGDGGVLSMDTKTLMSGFLGAANRKALTYGFILSMSSTGQWIVDYLSISGGASFAVVDYD